MSNVDDDIDKELYAFFYSATDEQELVHDIQRSVDKAKQAITTLLEQSERKARIEELETSLDKLIVQEGKLYKMFKSKSQEDKNICVGVKIMADRVRCLYDRISALKGEQ